MPVCSSSITGTPGGTARVWDSLGRGMRTVISSRTRVMLWPSSPNRAYRLPVPVLALVASTVDAVLFRTTVDRLHPYIVISLLTGARTEELRALRWDHVHLNGSPDDRPPVPPYMEVWRSVREGGDTKTRKSRRTLALPARCVDVLRTQRAQQAADHLAAGENWEETGLVFTTMVGTEMDAANVRRDLRRALRNVPGVVPAEWTPRELRHSFVSVLSDAGIPVEQISPLVGHRGTTVTELVYRHQLRPVIQTGATVMDELFAAPRPSR